MNPVRSKNLKNSADLQTANRTSNRMKVAIVCDWLIWGGAERVVAELHKMYPQAPIYTSYATNEWKQKLDNKVITGYLQRWPFSISRKFIPFLRARWFSRLDLSKFDLVISSSGAEAKGVKTGSGTTHVCYCHAPTHYYWDKYNQYMKSPGFGPFNWLARMGLRILVGPMRKWDYKAAQRSNFMIANSTHTQKMIKKYYGRDSVVVHPPVDVERFAQETRNKQQETRKGFLVAGRQAPYKHFDLAVSVCKDLDLPLTVVGKGPEHEQLVKIAGSRTKFFTGVSDEEMPKYFQSAEALIFPGVEDFGIIAIEALAAGTPVIAYKAGGVLDYLKEGKNGQLFFEQTKDSLAAVLKNFDASKYSPSDIKLTAQRFSAANFRENLRGALERVLK